MSDTMMGFFDQQHFAQNCSCYSEENKCGERCPVHGPAHSCESGDFATTSAVPTVEINQSFPRQPAVEHLTNLIEYRIKILAAEDLKFQPGEGGKVKTNTLITRKAGRLSMLMKPSDNLPLRFLNEGFISPSFRGPLTVELQNSSSENVHMGAGSLIAYMVLAPFIK